MHEEATESHSDQQARPLDNREDAVWWATWVGLALAMVGLVDGVVMAMQKRVADCPDGTFIPQGTTNFDCYVHPQAGVGIAIASLSVVLGILLVFSSMLVRAALARPSA